ncbi:MAG TPA: TonB family protein [Methylovirgula sp.]
MSFYTETILPPRQGRALPRWALAALIVLALHIGIGAFFILTRHIGEPPGQPPDALMIDLAPVSAAPPPQPETVPEEQAVMSKPVPPPPPEPNVLKTPIIPQAEAVLAPPPPKPVQKKVEKEQPKKVQKEKQQHAVQAHKAREIAPRAAAPAPGFSGQSLASWESEVRTRVAGAASRSVQASGTAVLSFTVDPSGHVGGAHLARSSGNPELDEATLSIASRIGEVPPPPTGRRTAVMVPVRYSHH